MPATSLLYIFLTYSIINILEAFVYALVRSKKIYMILRQRIRANINAAAPRAAVHVSNPHCSITRDTPLNSNTFRPIS